MPWRVTHGMWGHPLYATWTGMLSRCERADDAYYYCYGGRGITVCARWHDVQVFVADIERIIGPRPDGMTLDRIDNDGNYDPGNVQWATPIQQAQTRRPQDSELLRSHGRLGWQGRSVRVVCCSHCGAEFETRAAVARHEFCSRAHKAAYRRAHHLDDVEKPCHQCGVVFTSNRYDKTRHCSQSCAAVCQHAGGCPSEEVMPECSESSWSLTHSG